MQNITDFILESGISNVERSYREFCQMCTAHKVDPAEISVQETPRHNWRVFKGDRKVFLVSKYILNQAIIDEKKIKVKE